MRTIPCGSAWEIPFRAPLATNPGHPYVEVTAPQEDVDVVIGTVADTLARSVESVTDAVSEALFEPVIRLGVTGLARSGKSVFITSLLANLMNRGRMPQLLAASDGRIHAAFLQPQPNDTIPRFEYEQHLAALTASDPFWPESTRTVSELRLSLRVQPNGLMSGMQGPRTVHLDIVDYPGEWLLDLGLLEKSYAQWSDDILNRMKTRTCAEDYLALGQAEDVDAQLDEPRAQALASAFTAYLTTARDSGFSDCTPGRFLLPGDLAGSPVLTFAPLPGRKAARRGSLWREMERRYEVYKSRVVKPFFSAHFARLDRQVVLVDALGALHKGPAAVEDLRHTMRDILGAFRPGRNAFLTQLLMGRRVDRILFAATKADHLHHRQHGRLTAIMEALTRDARDRAQFSGAQTTAMSLAALRTTVEETRRHKGRTLDLVRGRLLESNRDAALFPGLLPDDPNAVLGPARDGASEWLDGDYSIMRFAPAPLSLRPGEGPPHIRLDRAAQFLIGDRL